MDFLDLDIDSEQCMIRRSPAAILDRKCSVLPITLHTERILEAKELQSIAYFGQEVLRADKTRRHDGACLSPLGPTSAGKYPINNNVAIIL